MNYEHHFAAAAAIEMAVATPALPLDRTCLGLAVRLACDDEAVASALAALLPSALTDAQPAAIITVRLARPDVVLPPLDAQLRHRDQGAERLFGGAGCIGRVDFAALRATAVLTADVLQEPVLLRDVVLAFVLSLLTRLDRTPVHAGAVGRGTAGIVLAAPSGTGKSTLVCAAHEHGLRVLSDDAVYVQLAPEVRVWGVGGPIFLSTDVLRWFPDLAAQPVVLRGNGEYKIAFDAVAADTPFTHTALCLMRRTGVTRPWLEAVNIADAVAEVAASLDPGFDVFRAATEPAVRALANAGAWRLELSEDPRAAIPLLIELLEHIEHAQP